MRRFLTKAHKSVSSGCWVWDAATTPKGYGLFSVAGKMQYAHRFSYELHKGSIPEGLELDHLCRNRACVNPDHLEAVTRHVNVRRGLVPSVQKARHAAQTHCKRGHEFTPENTRYSKQKDGAHRRRCCRICDKLRMRRRRAA